MMDRDDFGARPGGTLSAPKRAGWLACFSLAAAALLAGTVARAAEPGEPLLLEFVEGDVAGMSAILSEGGAAVIGFVEYRQHRKGDVLEIDRVSHFADGSSDEDHIEVRVGETLRTVRGRSIIRNTQGTPTADLTIDVAAGRITGFSGLGKERETYDETVALPPGTYWGPVLNIVLKNFDRNAVDGRLVFHTVVATPKPRVFDMEFVRKEATVTTRAGNKVKGVRFALSPAINFLIDPILRMFTPETDFFMQPGHPPAMIRFEGPRNFAEQKIRIE
jgi:hypothetical protein